MSDNDFAVPASADAQLLDQPHPADAFGEAGKAFHRTWGALYEFTDELKYDRPSVKLMLAALKDAYEVIYAEVSAASNNYDQDYLLSEPIAHVAELVCEQVGQSIGRFIELVSGAESKTASNLRDEERSQAANLVEAVAKDTLALLHTVSIWLRYLASFDLASMCDGGAEELKSLFEAAVHSVACIAPVPELPDDLPEDVQWHNSPLATSESRGGRTGSPKDPDGASGSPRESTLPVPYDLNGSDDELAKLLELPPAQFLETIEKDPDLLERMVEANLIELEPTEEEEEPR